MAQKLTKALGESSTFIKSPNLPKNLNLKIPRFGQKRKAVKSSPSGKMIAKSGHTGVDDNSFCDFHFPKVFCSVLRHSLSTNQLICYTMPCPHSPGSTYNFLMLLRKAAADGKSTVVPLQTSNRKLNHLQGALHDGTRFGLP